MCSVRSFLSHCPLLNDVFHQQQQQQRHTDIFDLVSGMQKEAIKEEKLEKEKKRELKERRRVKEMNRGKERDKEADREKGKDNKEVFCRKEGGFEFHIDITCPSTCAIHVLLSFTMVK